MDNVPRPSALQNILNMFRLSNMPTVPPGDDEVAGDVDEPPDRVPELNADLHKQLLYCKSTLPAALARRESLLTKAITAVASPVDVNGAAPQDRSLSRALSVASSQSVPSTAELTSDCELTSPGRSVSPSPPPPTARLAMPLPSKKPAVPVNQVIIAPLTQDDKPAVVDAGEAAVEKTLGRKRCIMFACADKSPEVPAAPKELTAKEDSLAASEKKDESQPRKCRLTFVCPTRQDSITSVVSTASNTQNDQMSKQPALTSPITEKTSTMVANVQVADDLPLHQPIAKKSIPSQAFHEFGSSQNETDSWVDRAANSGQRKLTLKDVMEKENAIRQIGEEAEQEAEEEAREQEEIENELEEEQEIEDDFAPSDDDDDDDDDDKKSDGGNESDDEGGFADSDDESDAGSEYQFWAPATTTAATSTDNLTHFSSRQRSRSSSLDSTPSQSSARRLKMYHPRRSSKPKAIRMRPGTPELPDSTDFVCGTLDEDRPMEAAYISCREQRKREKQVFIPQDIDPSFPTSDPDEEEDDEDLDAEESEPIWARGNFGAMEDDERGRHPSTIKVSPVQAVSHAPRPRPAPVKRTARSPAPTRMRSPPPPRRLFGHSPSRLRSPPRTNYRSPRGSPTNVKVPLGITINRLAQRPATDRTASLPHTPNPFFKNWRRGSPVTSIIPSGAVTPGADESVRPDLHIRGPVDIVMGLEKKRQKRRDKLWRQHCRKAAKEQSERRPVPGRGLERMKELGLECAERTRGYGLGQPAKLVLSL